MFRTIFIRNGRSSYTSNVIYEEPNVKVLNIYGRNEVAEACDILHSISGYNPNIIYCGIELQSRETANMIFDELQYGNVGLQKVINWRLTAAEYREKVSLKNINLKTAQFYIAARDESLELMAHELTIPPNVSKNVCCNYHLLKQTYRRVVPYWDTVIVPEIKNGKNVIVVASEDTIRALVQHVESNFKIEDVMKLDIPRGIPLCYQFDSEMRIIQFQEGDISRIFENYHFLPQINEI